MSEMINCGQKKIQKLGRISIKGIMDRYELKEGDVIEVYIGIDNNEYTLRLKEMRK